MNKEFFVYRHAWRYNGAPDCEPELSKVQCRELLKNGGWMVRNTFDFDCNTETQFWYIIKDSFAGLDELSSNERNKIRRAIKIFDYKLIEKELFQQKVHVFGNSCEYGIIGFMPEYKHNATYPYYGLFYKMNEYYLGEKHFKYVTDGSRSITEHSNIQPFLEQNFNFRKAYCKLKLHYKWWFGIIVRLLYPFRTNIPSRNVRAVLMMHGLQTKYNNTHNGKQY